jgi:hypothetical protein
LAKNAASGSVAPPLAKLVALLWKPKSSVAGSLPAGGVLAHKRRVAVEHLAIHKEVGLAVGLGVLQDRRPELLPELQVDVLDRVDPEAVDPKSLTQVL